MKKQNKQTKTERKKERIKHLRVTDINNDKTKKQTKINQTRIQIKQ